MTVTRKPEPVPSDEDVVQKKGEEANAQQDSADLNNRARLHSGASTQSLLEQDQVLMLGAHALEEERRLEEERQKEAPAEPAEPTQGVLDSSKFSKLEALLHKSEIYTKFLTEQLGGMEDSRDTGAAEYQATQAAANAARAEHSRLQQQHQEQQAAQQ
eukprot:CAMPEP_0202409242 /NCGR_PEP_ID=MMETSP1128-20130828/16596_1 /ASSEMBLY_ACC=CAM_ASM_000463 /TAXON_ID=3047 /ORGANISM="Dunaliella tertiolecta, Strain CCMP1320" /LENGTH=157 /DNA_ID=CAMNT_0049014537 /DNA_START=21 /DNA_END=491 /DNA_ORIENTATION=-